MRDQRAVDHPPDISRGHVVLELAKRFSNLRRKAADGSEVDEANFVVGHDNNVCRMRIGVEKKLFLHLTVHDDHELLGQRFGLDPLTSQLRQERLVIGVDGRHDLPHPHARHELAHQHFFGAVLEIDPRRSDVVAALCRTPPEQIAVAPFACGSSSR